MHLFSKIIPKLMRLVVMTTMQVNNHNSELSLFHDQQKISHRRSRSLDTRLETIFRMNGSVLQKPNEETLTKGLHSDEAVSSCDNAANLPPDNNSGVSSVSYEHPSFNRNNLWENNMKRSYDSGTAENKFLEQNGCLVRAPLTSFSSGSSLESSISVESTLATCRSWTIVEGEKGQTYDSVEGKPHGIRIGNELLDTKSHAIQTDLGATRKISENESDNLVLLIMGLASDAVKIQIWVVFQAFLILGYSFVWCRSFITSQFNGIVLTKERIITRLRQKLSLMMYLQQKVTANGSVILKKGVWGCVTMTYICILLSILMLPALLLDIAFMSNILEEPVNVMGPVHLDYTVPDPVATIYLNPSQETCSTNGQPAKYPKHVTTIPATHRVKVTVTLTLPESDYNRNLGVFQMAVKLISGTGQLIKSSSRPCMLQFHSAPVYWIRTFLALMGIVSDSQKLVIPIEFEQHSTTTSAIQIILQPKAGMQLGHGIPEIYNAEVHVESSLPWLKDLLHKWKWTFYFWSGLMVYISEVFIVFVCFRHAVIPKKRLCKSGYQNVKQNEDMSDPLDISGVTTENTTTESTVSYRHIPIGRVINLPGS